MPVAHKARRDPLQVAERRELVQTLHAQGLKPSAILRFMKKDPALEQLLTGITHPYQVITADIKAPGVRRRTTAGVTEESSQAALQEASGRLDALYAFAWEILKEAKEKGNVSVELLEQAQALVMTKARINGVSEAPVTRSGSPFMPGGGQNNFFLGGGGPVEWAKQLKQARDFVDAQYEVKYDDPSDIPGVAAVSNRAGSGEDSDSP